MACLLQGEEATIHKPMCQLNVTLFAKHESMKEDSIDRLGEKKKKNSPFIYIYIYIKAALNRASPTMVVTEDVKQTAPVIIAMFTNLGAANGFSNQFTGSICLANLLIAETHVLLGLRAGF